MYTHRSIIGLFLFLGDSLISRQNKKQDVISCSSCEAEFRVMTTTTREIIHVTRLLADFDVFLIAPTVLIYDNQIDVKIVTNSFFHERMKHIEIDCYFTRQHFTVDIISLTYFAQRSRLQTSLQSHTLQRGFEPCWANSYCLTHHDFEGGC